MERSVKGFAVVAVLLLLAVANDAQTICKLKVSDLMECKPAATPPNPPPPTSSCCAALSHADMRCLCSYKNSKLLPSLGIDPNLAMKLPTTCKLPHPAKC